MAKGPGRPISDQANRQAYDTYLQTLRSFDPPPENFDPHRANARELVRYGLPRRPNPKTEPHLFSRWQKALSRPLKPIRATFEIDQVILQRRHRLPARIARNGRFAPSGWGGIVAQPADFGFSPPEPANMVYGEWSIPSMEPDFDNPKIPMTVGFWVGLDGFGSNQVLQAGSAATVTGESIEYWVWFEWYPDPPVRIANFPISPGDLITVLVCAPQTDHGFVSMLNRTTGVTTSAGISAPAGITSVGATAEWIVEGISADLPNFVLMGFHNCAAGTKTHSIDLSHPIETEITGISKDLTLAVAWQAADTVLVFWEGIR